MTGGDDPTATPWRRPVGPRDPREPHRVATSLELLFDLCFVIAVSYASAGLHHAIGAGHAASGIVHYLTVFFAIWWAWMNFSWHASAYDNDDGVYRVATFVQIAGALVIAAGVPRAFDSENFDVVFVGYLVMRAGLAFLWLRAAHAHPQCRRTCLRFAAGITLAMAGWYVVIFTGWWPRWAWWAMAGVELLVPLWAERAAPTPWHPHHIAERFGLFTLIVLGESVLAATNAVREGVNDHDVDLALVGLIAGGLVIVFALWWIYFAKPAHRFLTGNRAGFVWGYGHYFIFASAAAVGAGIAVNVDRFFGSARIGATAAGAAIAVPVATFLLMVWLLHVRPNVPSLRAAAGFPVAVAGVLAAGFCPSPVPAVAGVLAAFLAFELWRSDRRYRRAVASQ